MTRSILAPVLFALPALLILLSMTAAGSLPQPWGALPPVAYAAPACGAGRVSSGAAEAARTSLVAALAARDRALSGGSGYVAAKVGLAPGSNEWARADAVQLELRMAEGDLAQACASAN